MKTVPLVRARRVRVRVLLHTRMGACVRRHTLRWWRRRDMSHGFVSLQFPAIPGRRARIDEHFFFRCCCHLPSCGSFHAHQLRSLISLVLSLWNIIKSTYVAKTSTLLVRLCRSNDSAAPRYLSICAYLRVYFSFIHRQEEKNDASQQIYSKYVTGICIIAPDVHDEAM